MAKSNKLRIFVCLCGQSHLPAYYDLTIWCKHLCFIKFTLFLFFYFELYTFGKYLNKREASMVELGRPLLSRGHVSSSREWPQQGHLGTFFLTPTCLSPAVYHLLRHGVCS